MKFPKDIFLAHTAETTEGALRAHELAEHLRHVAAGAAANAAHFGGEDWARLAGLWHDLGKYRPGFQRYIRECVDGHIEGRTPSPEKTHSAAGALHALAVFERIGGASGKYLARVLAYLIAGHHAGLADWSDSDAHIGLSFRLDKPESNAEYTQALDKAPDEITAAPSALPSLRNIPGGSAGLALWVRMLFSCLVDADFLDTERFMDADKADRRSGAVPLSDMLAVCDAFMTRKAADAPASHVNTLRAGILAECRRAAELPPGVFSLEVPTGGGKTLSSLAFALSHAVRHGKRRVIYAIPYTSIIEQTADVFRQVFAELGEVVVEHHSQAEADEREDTARSRLACENWDAPLIVTTNVQLFESLFAARTSRCRKLHNLVGSVIVLDEAQQLPPEFLQPILDALRLLVTHYGVTVVLCTATQPALGTTHFFGNNLRGLDNIRPIIAKPEALFTQLKRVRVHLPADMHTPTPWPVIAAQIAECDSVLAIVNTRKQARELHRLLPAGTLHLSNRMCGAHKARVIQEIKARLKAKRAGEDIRPLRIVSTSLIEAGVDLDVPVVFRALAGLDSLAQAAGRCNREGLLDGLGEVFLFIPPEAAPVGLMRKAADACISTLHGISGSPLDRALFEPYFRTYYRAIDTDKHRIGDLLTQNAREVSVAFRTAADRFRLIDDADTASVVVRYRAEDDDTVGMLLNTLAKNGPERWLMRKLQRYIVNIQEREASRLLQQGDIALIPAMPGLYLQANDLLYDHTTGLVDDTKPVKPCLLVL